MSESATRVERDLLGEKSIPASAYYGVQTARALENFHISGVQLRLYPNLIKAFAMVKMAAARANCDCGQFDRKILSGIEAACRELIEGKLHDEFRLDVFQGGAGTSTNMNANEVIANRWRFAWGTVDVGLAHRTLAHGTTPNSFEDRVLVTVRGAP